MQILKSFILFLSAMCVALLAFLAYHSEPLHAAGFVFFIAILCAGLVYAYSPKFRRVARAILLGIVACWLVWMIVDIVNGDFRLPPPGNIVITALALYCANRARREGFPYFPNDNRKVAGESNSGDDIKNRKN